MNRFKNILLVIPADTDGDGAIETAAKLARDNAGKITLFDVVPKLSTRVLLPGSAADRKKIQKAVVDHRKDELVSLTNRRRGVNFQPRVKVASGTPFIEIVRQVLRGNHDIVIKPAEGASRLRLLGSTDMHLMRKCPCPVWVLKSGKHSRVKKIMAAVDPVGAQARKLSARVVDIAGTLCSREGASLEIVHAWNFPHENALRTRSVMTPDAIAQLRADIEEGHEQEVRKLLGRRALRDLKPKLRVIEGHASKIIPQLAGEGAADVIVMGSVGRTGVAGLFVGNTAERVLNQVTCSVIAVKPDGFVTPVEV